jgi:hypothetical protein
MSKLIVEIQEDGTIKTNGREMVGTEAEMLEELNALATELGGELVVEKHEPGVHHHHHGRGGHHHHGKGGGHHH